MYRHSVKTSRLLLWAGWLLLFPSVLGAYWPVKKVKLEKQKPMAEPGFKSAVSTKNLLKLSRPNPTALPFARPVTEAAVETLKILALRVEFQKEIPDDPTTTGTGVFDRRTQQEFLAQEGHLVDPAPHDKKYFESHIQALDQFYQTVSNGKLKIIGEVWPPVGDSAYQLPHPQAFYGSPNLDSVIFQISKFFKDAVRSVDSVSPEIHFANYQSLVIFHAGSSRQDDIFRNTPNDFFTGFLRLGDSVLVDSGTTAVTEGIMLPESPSQDNRIVGLNATFAHEFGHQLGLVDIYNTETKITQVGDFSLMDNNGQDVAVELDFGPVGGRIVLASGLLAVYPDAWSRAFLGFLDTLAVTRGPVNLSLLAGELQRKGIEAVKIPISAQEYFILENRAADVDSFAGSALKVDPVTSVVLGPARPDGDSSVFTGEYDILLPGSGILIWHVDEAVALEAGCSDNLGNVYSRFVCNTVNNDPSRRFLELKEADGFVDFGGNYYTGAFGFAEDMFWAPNNTAFTPTSNPSSRSKFGGQTGISVTGIGPPDTVMSVSVSSNYLLPGWPQYAAPLSPKEPPVLGDLNGDGLEEVLAISGPFLLVWNQDGSKFIPNEFERSRLALNGDTLSFPFAVVGVDTSALSNPNASFSFGPVGADLNNDGRNEIFVGSITGAVWGFASEDADNDSLADILPGFPRYLRGGRITSLLFGRVDTFANPLVFAGTSSGKGFLISGEGIPRDSTQFKGSVRGASLDSSGNLFVTTDRNDSVFIYKGIDSTASWPRVFATDSVSAPVLAQGDSGIWVAFTTAGGQLYLLDGNGNTVSGFPVSLGTTGLPQPIWSHSAVTGQPVIVLAFDNQIVAFQTNGLLVPDFPKSIDQQRPENGSFIPLAGLDREALFRLVSAAPAGEFMALRSPPAPTPKAILGIAAKSGNMYFPLAEEREASFVLGGGSNIFAPPAATTIDSSSSSLQGSRVFVRSEDGFVYGYQLGYSYSFAKGVSWAQTNYDFSGANFLPGFLIRPTRRGDLVEEKSFYNYPNPVLNGTTALRYRLNSSGAATLSVFDMAGHRIREPQGVPAEVGNDNEVQLDCSGFAAGVYLCRLEVNAPGKKEVVFCKMAVVK